MTKFFSVLARGAEAEAAARPVWLRHLWRIAVLAFIVLIVANIVIYSRDYVATKNVGAGAPEPAARAIIAETATSAPSPTASSAVAVGSRSSTDVHPTPSPEPGERVLTLRPRAGDAGWWTSGEASGNHLGDSFLYAGYYDEQAFASTVRFELAQVPRGAPIRAAQLRLTGLNSDRLNAATSGVWTIQLLAADALPDYRRANFQAVVNAPAAVTLFPTLSPFDLGEGEVNVFQLDATALNWLQGQVIDAAPALIVRITGPGAGESVFAWDSGAGLATSGNAPQLLLSLGAAPPTPPPLPTEAVIVATLTPTPANVLTAAADALAATLVATTAGTATPLPYRVVTPTPPPANLATAQALGALESFVPIVIHTPTPANEATAAADAQYATAVAVTTGTFTPVPDDAVTPVIVLPTLFPENVVTAAAQVLAATAQARQVGTVTPVPTGALIATVTVTRPVILPTLTPANRATAAARVAEATAIAITTGTFTPIPRNAVTPTPEPRATPLPLLVPVTPLPTPTLTSTPPASLPAALVGKILFYSDRTGDPKLYALDPATGQLFQMNADWPFVLAQARERRSPDGGYSAEVQIVTDVTETDSKTGAPSETQSAAVIFVRSNEYQTTRELTTHDRFSYDPAWSPVDNQIAFVSRDESDEIYVINGDGSNLRRLTSNAWEWDKHPSWSPDGKQIVFWSNRGTGRRQLWIMNADGSNQRPLMSSTYNDWDPIWVK
jgi:hypothetical protein